ncbi:polysaccharide deacetylase family protein [Streptomyces sp. NPDC051133]|uniref:polysaccharide deacetylase family protein n=1 Tax=Streptomyces sp. NPDC051133 TaxID=3155521 RepID=UPI003422F86C
MTPRRTVVTTSWDDGHRLDTALADLLARYDVPGTFYIAPRNVELRPADRLPAAGIRDLAARGGVEIGGHTLSHLRLPLIDDTSAREQVALGKIELENIIGAPVVSFCYPRGEYRAVHVRQVAQAGFRLARTVRRSSLATGPVMEMATTVNAYAHRVDVPLVLRLAGGRPARAAQLYRHWDELAIRWFDLCLERGGVYHLWGHSWEVDARGDWARLERVLAYISGRPDVRYVTNGTLAEAGAA